MYFSNSDAAESEFHYYSKNNSFIFASFSFKMQLLLQMLIAQAKGMQYIPGAKKCVHI